MFSYYKRVFGRAFQETLQVFGWEKAGVVWSRLSIFIIVAAILIATGWYKLAFDQLWVGVIALVAGFGLFPFVLVRQIMMAAYLMDKEAQDNIKALQGPESDYDEGLASALSDLLNESVDLLDRQNRLSMGPEYTEWVNRVSYWCERAEWLIQRNLPPGEFVAFQSISAFPTHQHSGDELRTILTSRHSKLRLIAMRYMEQAPKPRHFDKTNK